MTQHTTIDTESYRLRQGSIPVLVSIPHLGVNIPDHLQSAYTPVAAQRADTDWHLDTLYAFASELGASVLQSRLSRYVIDLNRASSGESLYPGQNTTGLCPTQTFRNEPLYREGMEPSAADVQHRVQAYWQPYHDALATELQRLRALHGQVLLWEAHSIASVLPYLFEGKLPDFNFGTHEGRACAAPLLDTVVQVARSHPEYSVAINGRFKGGYITRHYGAPDQGVHAIQLEMCQCLYMEEAAPFAYAPERAARVQSVLHAMLRQACAQLAASTV